MAKDTHEINLEMQPGLPILERRKGAWCCLCGGYSRHRDQESADRTKMVGCESCKPSYKKRLADKEAIGGLIFDDQIENG